MSDFKIGWLFPDTLFLHGERGNLLALARFAQLAGLSPVVEKIDFSTEGFEPANYDVLFCAPGEIACFQDVVDWLTPYKDKLTGFVSERSTERRRMSTETTSISSVYIMMRKWRS